jgi:hypothetical protein
MDNGGLGNQRLVADGGIRLHLLEPRALASRLCFCPERGRLHEPLVFTAFVRLDSADVPDGVGSANAFHVTNDVRPDAICNPRPAGGVLYARERETRIEILGWASVQE